MIRWWKYLCSMCIKYLDVAVICTGTAGILTTWICLTQAPLNMLSCPQNSSPFTLHYSPLEFKRMYFVNQPQAVLFPPSKVKLIELLETKPLAGPQKTAKLIARKHKYSFSWCWIKYCSHQQNPKATHLYTRLGYFLTPIFWYMVVLLFIISTKPFQWCVQTDKNQIQTSSNCLLITM